MFCSSEHYENKRMQLAQYFIYLKETESINQSIYLLIEQRKVLCTNDCAALDNFLKKC